MTGIELPCEAGIERNFMIDHFGGNVISGYAMSGDNCQNRKGVVVGLRCVDQPCAQVIGNNLDVGAWAKVAGVITIGTSVAVGPNAVVIDDAPSNSRVLGVTANIKC